MKLWSKRQSTVGRELDHGLAILSGEAAHQKIKKPEPGKGSPALPVWGNIPSQPGGLHNNYYQVPLLKEPVWIWSVPAYFYVGGVAGGSAVLAALLHGNHSTEKLGSACRWLAFLGTTVAPGLLTWDLGRKFRFLNMLRVFRPTSPMSIGSWTLTGAGGLATLALLQGDRPSAKPTLVALAATGTILSGYTGVLLANTANPLWQGARVTLPVLFTASAMASTAAVLEMMTLNHQEQAIVNRLGTIGKLAEAASIMAMEKEVASNSEAAKSFKKGKGGFLWLCAKGFLAAGFFVKLFPGSSPRKRRVGAVLTTAGSICLRFALLELGKQAASEPQVVIAGQRIALQQERSEINAIRYLPDIPASEALLGDRKPLF